MFARSTRLLRSSLTPSRVSRYSTAQQPPPTPGNPPPSSSSSSSPPPRDNAYKSYYKGFGRPVAFNLLIAMVTFQAIYWSWLKLESIEEKADKNSEIASLTRELKELTEASKSNK